MQTPLNGVRVYRRRRAQLHGITSEHALGCIRRITHISQLSAADLTRPRQPSLRKTRRPLPDLQPGPVPGAMIWHPIQRGESRELRNYHARENIRCSTSVFAWSSWLPSSPPTHSYPQSSRSGVMIERMAIRAPSKRTLMSVTQGPSTLLLLTT